MSRLWRNESEASINPFEPIICHDFFMTFTSGGVTLFKKATSWSDDLSPFWRRWSNFRTCPMTGGSGVNRHHSALIDSYSTTTVIPTEMELSKLQLFCGLLRLCDDSFSLLKRKMKDSWQIVETPHDFVQFYILCVMCLAVESGILSFM